MEEFKVKSFTTSDRERYLFSFERKLLLYEHVWNPNKDEIITWDHFFKFVEEGFILNFTTCQMEFFGYRSEQFFRESCTPFGLEIFFYDWYFLQFWSDQKMKNLYSDTNNFIPNSYKILYAQDKDPNIETTPFQTILFDGTEIWERFSHLFSQTNDIEKKLNYLISLLISTFLFPYLVRQRVMFKIFYSEKEKIDLLKDFVSWENEDFKQWMLYLGEKKHMFFFTGYGNALMEATGPVVEGKRVPPKLEYLDLPTYFLADQFSLELAKLAKEKKEKDLEQK